MTTQVCRALYSRGDDQVALRCTYPQGHENSSALPNDHSWYAVRCADTAEAAKVDYTPQAVQAFLDSIARGEMDVYLEAILATAHSRKRARRGTVGFTH